MCLNLLKSDKEEDVIDDGYKVFKKIGENIYGVYIGCNFRIKEWNIAHSQKIELYKGCYYNSGFHLFIKKLHAELYREHLIICGVSSTFIQKVKYSTILARGITFIDSHDVQVLDCNAETLVVKKLWIDEI